MAKIDSHPTVRLLREQGELDKPRTQSTPNQPLGAAEIRQLCLDAGADDIGFVSLDREELDDQRVDILDFFPKAKTLISIVVRMNREPIRSTARSVANLEFHSAGEQLNHASREIVSKLEEKGIPAINPSMGFPMEMANYPGKIWGVSHKPVAVAAGLGQMGIHRNVIHPKFGNFILLGTIVIGAEVNEESKPVEYNPCLDCKLCVAACPVGAISPNGSFNFSACFTHNYREFMGGFTDWVEDVADSKSAKDYRNKVDDAESASVWQSLSFGANYKAAYCLSVCPAGEDVILPFLEDRAQFVDETLKPLQQKEEVLYVQPGSDAEEYAAKRFPHKTTKHVGRVLRPTSIAGFIRSMHLVFQPGKSKGLDAVYHFRFTGKTKLDCTVSIREQVLEVRDGLSEECDLRITADSEAWLRFLRKDTSIVWLILTRRVRLKGDPRLLLAFGKCFP